VSGRGTFLLAAGVAAASALLAGAAPKGPARLLVVTVTKGFHHDSIATIEKVLQGLADSSKAFTLDYARTDEDLAAKASVKALAAYDGVVFASTTGDLPLPDRDGFINWIGEGHAFVGIHAATDTFPGFPGYLDMIGGQFKHHGPQTTVEAFVRDADSPATRDLPKSFSVFDEIYQFQRYDPARVHVLLAMTKHPETREDGEFPLAWTREQGKGRVFYTALGHREDVLQAGWYKWHLMGGIRWALGQDAAS
jgi:hypothetical protein